MADSLLAITKYLNSCIDIQIHAEPDLDLLTSGDGFVVDRKVQQKYVVWHGHQTTTRWQFAHTIELCCYMMNMGNAETNLLQSQLILRFVCLDCTVNINFCFFLLSARAGVQLARGSRRPYPLSPTRVTYENRWESAEVVGIPSQITVIYFVSRDENCVMFWTPLPQGHPLLDKNSKLCPKPGSGWLITLCVH